MITKKINENVSVGCAEFMTRKSWGHIVDCFYNGERVEQVRVNYQNRTWESYKYQTALLKLVSKLDKLKTIPLKDRIEMYKFISPSRFSL